jgi:hypothetical protein
MAKLESDETIINNGNSERSAVWVCTVHFIRASDELPHRVMSLGWRAAATDEGRDALRTSEHVGDFWLARVEPRAQDLSKIWYMNSFQGSESSLTHDNQIKRNHDKTY